MPPFRHYNENRRARLARKAKLAVRENFGERPARGAVVIFTRGGVLGFLAAIFYKLLAER